jgi:predicted glycosyltransferase involved in capsule biosynthesis
MELLGRVPDCHYCICDFRHFSVAGFAERSHFDDAPAGFWEEARRDFGSSGFVIDRNMFTDFLTFFPVVPSTNVIGRQLFQRLGGWNLETSRYCAQDFEFHLLCANQPPIAVVPEVLVHYRRHAGNWSADDLLQVFGSVEILEYMLSRYEVAREHEGRLRMEIEQRTQECADRAFSDRRLSLFRQYLGKLPLRRRPARLIARHILTCVLPEQALNAIGRSVRTARSKLSAQFQDRGRE